MNLHLRSDSPCWFIRQPFVVSSTYECFLAAAKSTAFRRKTPQNHPFWHTV